MEYRKLGTSGAYEIQSMEGKVLQQISTGFVHKKDPELNASIIVTTTPPTDFREIDEPIEDYVSPKKLNYIESLKQTKILKTKQILESYIADNPLYFDGKYYNVSFDKQLQFTAKYNSSKLLGIEMCWNATGELCVVWDAVKCIRFLKATNNYINPLVEWQQKKEIEIKAITTEAELDTININIYDTFK